MTTHSSESVKQGGQNMSITLDDVSDQAVIALLEEHLSDMYRTSPPESVHALDVSGLQAANIRFWVLRLEGKVAGCGAIKCHNEEFAEVKSMRTANAFRGCGLGRILMEHIEQESRTMGIRRLSLETGSQDFFQPARAMYRKFGFVECGPFADYEWDDNSVFMSKELVVV